MTEHAVGTRIESPYRQRTALGRSLLKRSLDIAILLPGALIGMLLVAIGALAVLAVSRGNPFYGQMREGLGGRPFKVWKLRTMHVNAEQLLEQHLRDHPEAREEWERTFKLRQDPRIIPVVGHLLRRTSLDELPQLWNVACGEMTFVGPRPFPEYHLQAFDGDFRALRRTVPPGLTGLWQVSGRADGDIELQRVMDERYIREWSIGLELYVLLLTPWVVLQGRGAR